MGGHASLSIPRASHTATLLSNSQVLVASGSDNGALSSAELYGVALPTPSPSPSPSPGPKKALENISTRLSVGTGDDVLIGGFIVTGSVPKKVVLRAIGPSLSDFGVSNPLADPILNCTCPMGPWLVMTVGKIVSRRRSKRPAFHPPMSWKRP